MGPRVIAGVILGVAAVVVAVAFADCLPQPEDEIEWLQREDAVIVQIQRSGGYTISPGGYDLTAPPATLYGDGTLIFTGDDAGGRFNVLEAQVSDDAIQNLLEEIADSGFFNFPYQLASPVNATDLGTAYVYVNTKLAANATSAYALGADSANDETGGSEFAQYRSLAEIVGQLGVLQPAAASEYQPDHVHLVVVAMAEPPGGTASPETWRIDGIELSTLATADAGIGERIVSGGTMTAVTSEMRAMTFRRFQEGGRVYSVGYRPVLPYEEHFPEFGPAQ